MAKNIMSGGGSVAARRAMERANKAIAARAVKPAITTKPKSSTPKYEVGKTYAGAGGDISTIGAPAQQPVRPEEYIAQRATTTNPVITRTDTSTEPKAFDIPQAPDQQLMGLSRTEQESYLDQLTLKGQYGETISPQEQMNAMAITRQLSQPDYSGVENLMEQEQTRLQQLRDAESTRVKTEAGDIYEQEAKLAKQISRQDVSEQREDLQTAIEQQLRILGPSAQSTAASRVVGELQDTARKNIEIMQQQEKIELMKSQAARNGASSELLQQYDGLLLGVAESSTRLNLQIADAVNQANVAAGSSYEEKLQNIMAMGQTMDQTPLTPNEESLVEAYSVTLLDDNLVIDSNVLESIPPRLVGAAMQAAGNRKLELMQQKGPAEAGQVVKIGDMAYQWNPETQRYDIPIESSIDTQDFGFTNVGGGLIAVTDPTTGEVSFKQGPQAPGEQKFKSVEVGGKLYSFDESTGSFSPFLTGQRQILDEEVVNTGMDNVYGSKVKLKPTVFSMVETAQATLESKGIDLKIADSYRSFNTQKNAYESGKKGVASPESSFHVQGQAIDLSQLTGDNMKNEEVFQALRNAGLQQHPGEWRHRSYGEFGDTPATKSLLDVQLPTKMTEGQRKSYGFGTRMAESQNLLVGEGLELFLPDKTRFGQKIGSSKLMPDMARSQKRKQYEQAKENFITAVLRQESGAVIGQDEFTKEERKYFPLPGDKKAVIDQKRDARETAIKVMLKGAGKDEDGNPLTNYYKPIDPKAVGDVDDLLDEEL